MADKRCDNGHFIDESWDICPYCPAQNGSAEIPVVRPSRFDAPRASDHQPQAPERRAGVAEVPAPIPIDRTVTGGARTPQMVA